MVACQWESPGWGSCLSSESFSAWLEDVCTSSPLPSGTEDLGTRFEPRFRGQSRVSSSAWKPKWESFFKVPSGCLRGRKPSVPNRERCCASLGLCVPAPAASPLGLDRSPMEGAGGVPSCAGEALFAHRCPRVSPFPPLQLGWSSRGDIVQGRLPTAVKEKTLPSQVAAALGAVVHALAAAGKSDPSGPGSGTGEVPFRCPLGSGALQGGCSWAAGVRLLEDIGSTGLPPPARPQDGFICFVLPIPGEMAQEL